MVAVLKIVGIIILILLAICAIYRSTISHKVGYVLIVLYILTYFISPIQKKLSTYFLTHESLGKFYELWLFVILLAYGAIGVIEGLIRMVDDEFTFFRSICHLIEKKKRKKISAKSINTDEHSDVNVSDNTESNKNKYVEYAKIVNSDKHMNIDDIIAELNRMIGLNSVKREITELIKMEEYQQKRKAEGLKYSDRGSYHLIFSGNPGTGKTTVARMVAGIYHNLGIVSKGQFIEVDRAGLVAEYSGQTAPKTLAVISKAIGGVLFIDEAYSLIQKGLADGDAYGREALDTLLKAMEDNRNDLVVIMAGYTQEMEKFVAVNPGLKSRFKKTIYFEDYTPDELVEIFKSYVKNDENAITQDAEDVVDIIFRHMYENRDEKFGNGRFVRNMYNSIIQQLGVRVSMLQSPSREELQTIIREDVLKATEEQNIILFKENMKELNNTVVLEEALSDDEIDRISLRTEKNKVWDKNQPFWDSEIEPKVYKILKEFINDEYTIVPHETLAKIFQCEWTEENKKITSKLNYCHYDFVVYNSDFCPVMLMEVNGSKHQKDKYTIVNDNMKKKIAAKKKLKLVCIDFSDSIPDNEIKDKVEKSIREAIPDKDSVPAYCPKCHAMMALRQNRSTMEWFYSCPNKHKNNTYSAYKIPPLYDNLLEKIDDNVIDE